MSPYKWLKENYPLENKEDGRAVFPFDLTSFAYDADVNYLYLYRHLTGIKPPNYELMKLFYVASSGEIGLADWIRFHNKRLRDG